MYANPHATKAYRHSAAEHVVDTADGYTLVRSLMTRLIARLAMAKHCIAQNDIASKGEHLSQAINIIDVLQVAVDERHNPKLAENLIGLYDYMSRQLLSANLHNDVALIDEVDGLVRQVKEAWDAIGTTEQELGNG
ncbi:MAG: flagellar export chaperone FliS [Pseudomonadota bacterium]